MATTQKTGPTFGKAASHISDVQLRHALTPDGKTNTILFDNFTARVEPGGPPVATRTLSIVFPLEDTAAGGTLAMDIRGAAMLDSGASGTVIVRALGKTHVLEPLHEPNDPVNFTKHFSLNVPAGSNLSMTFVVVAEQGTALVALDAVDLSLGPAGRK